MKITSGEVWRDSVSPPCATPNSFLSNLFNSGRSSPQRNSNKIIVSAGAVVAKTGSCPDGRRHSLVVQAPAAHFYVEARRSGRWVG
jgi:hypothetical protein